MIQIETSTACDARCVFCPHPFMKRKGGEMRDHVFEKILSEAKQLQLGEVLLFLNGEPLLFPRLFKWLARLRQEKFKTSIFTNANALTEEKSIELISYSDVVNTVVFSLGGVDKETYLDIMGLNFDKIRENVETFMKLNEGKIAVAAMCPLFSKTAPLDAKWHSVWDNIIGHGYGFTTMFNFAGLIHDELEHREDERHAPAYCGRLGHLVILYDGRVCLCCMDAEGQVILGDVKTQSLLSIYNSPLARKYREFHTQKRFSELPLCRDCNMNITLKGVKK
jgi:radical SAM protein with 4Fe4S-binding SPASM domain